MKRIVWILSIITSLLLTFENSHIVRALENEVIPNKIIYAGLTSPVAISVDSAGISYVLDMNTNRVLKYNSNGNYIGLLSNDLQNKLSKPSDLTIDSNDNIYILNSGKNQILKYSKNGALLKQWGSTGNKSVQLNKPTRIEVDKSENVYVIDSVNYRIVKFDSNGNYKADLGKSGIDFFDTRIPLDIAVDKDSNVYVLASGAIIKYDSNGNELEVYSKDLYYESRLYIFNDIIYVSGYSTGGELSGEFMTSPERIGRSSIQKYSLDGKSLGYVGTPSETIVGKDQLYYTEGSFDPYQVSADKSGNLYIIEIHASDWPGANNGTLNVIKKVDSGGNFLLYIGNDYNSGEFSNPKDIGLDSKGNINILSATSNVIVSFDSKGEFLNYKKLKTQNSTEDSFSDFVFDSKQNIYVADEKLEKILKFDSDGNFVKEFKTYEVLARNRRISSISIDKSDNIFVCQGSLIFKYDLDGNITSIIGKTEFGENIVPYTVLVDNFGIIYIDTSSGIYKFDANGKQLGTINLEKNGIYGVVDIKFDSKNNMYLSGYQYIYIFDSNGNYLKKIKEAFDDKSNFTYLTLDLNDNLYVLNRTLNKVSILTSVDIDSYLKGKTTIDNKTEPQKPDTTKNSGKSDSNSKTPSSIQNKILTISLNKKVLNLKLKNQVTLKAILSSSITKNDKLSWVSSNPKVASVDSNGKVTAKSKGTSKITATIKGTSKSATCLITVVN